MQAIDWLQETGEYFLSSHTSPGDTSEKTQELLKEYEDFRVSAKVKTLATVIYDYYWKFIHCHIVLNFYAFVEHKRNIFMKNILAILPNNKTQNAPQTYHKCGPNNQRPV